MPSNVFSITLTKSNSSVYYTIRLPWEDGYWKPFHYLAFVFFFFFPKTDLVRLPWTSALLYPRSTVGTDPN